MDLHLEVRWRLGGSDAKDIEPMLFELLEAIEQGGSIRIAASRCRVSYRYAWGLVQQWGGLLGAPLCVLERGRGARLTALGEGVLWGRRRITASLSPTLEGLASNLSAELRAATALPADPPLRIYASHGLAISALRQLMRARGGVVLDLQFRGSLESLRLLHAGRCDLAGFHIADGSLGERLAPRYQRWLRPEAQVLIHVVHRQQGLITAREPARPIQSLRDLAAGPVRFVNRQAGSGTRLLFDALIEEAGVRPEEIQGYDTEEFTHLAVAALIASGAADCGFGIQAAAHQFSLPFLPVTRERYCFALARDTLASAAVTELIALLRSPLFREHAAALPGYDARESGSILPVESLVRAVVENPVPVRSQAPSRGL
ncbi:MAG: helix-turn-helix transcriptional regulator [Beggiatoa sp.]|nr:helix-turn-helix transcriptional regulator [Beggiatoa sp.]